MHRLVWVLAAAVSVPSCKEATKRHDPASIDAALTEIATPKKPSTTTFTRLSGGSATTRLAYGIAVNPKSTLLREWITAHDTTMPARLDGTVGVRTVYTSGGTYSSGEYRYVASLPITARDSISAVEVRIVLFDIWGNFVKTLSQTVIEDIPAGTERTFAPVWRVWDESEVAQHYGSLVYIARVRTADGRVFEANFDPIVEEAQKISQRFTPEDLNPNHQHRRDSSTVRTR